MLPVGILLVNADAHIVHANAAARTMLSVGEPIACSRDRLWASHMQTRTALVSATKQVALADRSQPTGQTRSVALSRWSRGRGSRNATAFKTHLAHIYAKTQTSDQLGLYRLAGTLSWSGAVTPLDERSMS